MSHPERAIERAILDRFAHVFGRNRVGGGEIGDGAGDFEDAAVGAGAQVQRHRHADQLLGFVAELAVLFDLE